MSKNVKKKSKLKNRTKFTIFSMFNITWYTVVVLVAAFTNHSVPSELTVSWFAAWTTELAILFGIKIKSKDEDDNNSQISSLPEIQNNIENSINNVINNYEVEDGFPPRQSDDFDIKYDGA